MLRSTDRILTTHVGSLVRPPALRAVLERRRDGEDVPQDQYETTLTAAVDELVRDQVAARVDVVSDGEAGKGLSWATYVLERMGGIEHRGGGAPMEQIAEMSTEQREFPEFWAEYRGTQGFEDERNFGWAATGPMTYAGQAVLQRDIDNLKSAADTAGADAAFLPVVAPASLVGIDWSAVYASEEEFLFALADVLREEYIQILGAGLQLQVDDAMLPYTYDLMVPPATITEYRAWAQPRVDALNHALRGLPEDRIRYHICWGSFNSPHTGDVPFKEIADLILQVNAGAYLIEMANPRHEHEWRVWEDVRLADGKTLVPGVISHCTNVVEHPELVAERIVRLAGLVGRESVVAGTDCGFAQGPFAQRVHPSIQWAKLKAMADGAEIATKTLWPDVSNQPIKDKEI